MPCDINDVFPFDKYRVGQKEAIERIVNSKERHVVISAPTGSGKSIIGYTAARCKERDGLKSALLTREIFLQHQYRKTFTDLAMVFGRNNFDCIFGGGAETALCRLIQNQKLPCMGACSYYQSIKAAREAAIIVTNYQYYFLSVDFQDNKNIGKRDWVCFDEAHNLAEFLISYNSAKIGIETIKAIQDLTVSIGRQVIEQNFGKIPVYDFDIMNMVEEVLNDMKRHEGNWKEQFAVYYKRYHITFNDWLSAIVKEYQKLFGETIPAQFGFDLQKEAHVKKYHKKLKDLGLMDILSSYDALRHLNCRCNTVVKSVTEKDPKYAMDWMIDVYETGFQVVPLDSKNFINELLKNSKMLYMSAMINPRYDLGLSPDEYELIEMPSMFPAANAPIMFMPVANFTKANRDEAIHQISLTVDDLLDHFKDVKGVIHTVSYENAKYLQDHCWQNSRFIIPPTGKDRMKVIEDFRKTKNGILLSPSLLEGVDLPDDDARFQIFIKVPYLSLGDKLTRIRTNIDQRWYQYQAVKSIVQGAGRGVRHENDQCATFILDRQFERLPKDLFPKWFLERMVR